MTNIFAANDMMRAARLPHSSHPSQQHHEVSEEYALSDDDDWDSYEFERLITGRSSVSSITIATSNSNNNNSTHVSPPVKSPLPLSRLHGLDQHYWNNEPNILGKWAAGAGIGYYSNSVTDAMFTPGSPPRRKAPLSPLSMSPISSPPKTHL